MTFEVFVCRTRFSVRALRTLSVLSQTLKRSDVWDFLMLTTSKQKTHYSLGDQDVARNYENRERIVRKSCSRLLRLKIPTTEHFSLTSLTTCKFVEKDSWLLSLSHRLLNTEATNRKNLPAARTCGWLAPVWYASACFPSSRPGQSGGRWTQTPGPPGLCWSSPGVTTEKWVNTGNTLTEEEKKHPDNPEVHPCPCLYLQVVEALLQRADEVGNLLILQRQRVGDLTQRLLKKERKN